MLHFFILNPDLTPPYIWVVLQIQLLQNPDHRSPARSEPKSSGFSRTPTIFSSGRVMMMVVLKRLMKTLMIMRFSRPNGSSSSYHKIDKTESMRLKMKHRKAEKLIAKTLENADLGTYKGFVF
ncbi:hypothetical protein QYF36_012540 [Acer negundo]|nr:hypothetical protein QYF36_012540 [Acer negundo]